MLFGGLFGPAVLDALFWLSVKKSVAIFRCGVGEGV